MDSFEYVKHLAGLPATRRQVFENLVRQAFYEDFEARQVEDEDQDFSRVLSQIVETAVDCPDEQTAFVMLRDLGIEVTFETFEALDSIYNGYDHMLARMLAATLNAQGRDQPIKGARVVRKRHGYGVAADAPWLAGSGRCLFVPLSEDGRPVYEHEGMQIASIPPWHTLISVEGPHGISPSDLDAGLPAESRKDLRSTLSLHETTRYLEAMRREKSPDNPVWEAEIREATPAHGLVRVAAPRIATMMSGLSELRRGFSGSDPAKARAALASLKEELAKLEPLVQALS